MSWYYYSGVVCTPVPVGNGEVVSVRPHTKVFVDPSVEATPEVQRLKSKGVFTPTSWPRDGKSLVPEVPVEEAVEVVSKQTPYAEALIENPGAVEVEKPASKKAPAKRKSAPKKKAAKAKKAAAEESASTESDPKGSED